MSDTKLVQHKSGQGEKWEVHAESMQVWYCLFNGKPYEGNLVLPKSEYVICDPPEVWEKVVVSVGAPINSKTFLIYDSIGIAVGKIIMDQPGYRVKDIVMEKRHDRL